MVSGQLPPEENYPLLRSGVWVKVRVSFRVGGNHTIAHEENCPPVRVRVLVRVFYGVGGQFSSGELVLIMQILRYVFIGGKCLKGRDN